VDATCDPLWYEVVPIVMEDVAIEGKPAKGRQLVRRRKPGDPNEPGEHGGPVVAIRLGPLKKGESTVVELNYRCPGAFASWNGTEPSLKVDVLDGLPGYTVDNQADPDDFGDGAPT